MKVVWSDQASLDVTRLYDFLLQLSPTVAAKTATVLISAPDRLMRTPRLGERVERAGPEEVRHIVVDHYELRYEVRPDTIVVLRIWHTRENR